MQNLKVRTRFAPSPTGYLHIGGLRTALYAFLFAKKNGGKFILRLEDTDQTRLIKGADRVIYDSLKNAGLIYDEGPDIGGDFGPYIQSKRKEIYQNWAKELISRKAAYYCFCAKERLDAMHKDGVQKYDKHCLGLEDAEINKKLKDGKVFVIRQNMPTTGTAVYHDLVFGEIKVAFKELEDNVLIKSDGFATYNLANVIDDYLMEINYVIRGVEYLSSTPKYNHLYDSLGWERPNYIHLQPIMRDPKNKLSKRHGAASLSDFIKKGFLAEAIINYIALLGWSPKDDNEKFSLSQLLDRFSLEGLSRSPSIFDEVKMRYINSLYIRELSLEDFHSKALPFYKDLDYLKGLDLKYLSRLLHSRVEVLSDAAELTRFLAEFDLFDLSAFDNEKWKTSAHLAKDMLAGLITLIDSADSCEAAMPVFDADAVNHMLEGYATKSGLKKGQVMWVFRIALTGAKNTPGGAGEMAQLLGRNEALRRLNLTNNRLLKFSS